MSELFRLVVVLVAVLALTACASNRGRSGLLLVKPPTLAEVVVTKNACDDIVTQTKNPTCPFIGSKDPKDVVCQVPSRGSTPTKMIEWTSSDAFTLEFPNGNPWVPAGCNTSTPGTTFTCVIRRDTNANPLAWYYKYDVVYSEDCRLDPGIYLVR